MKNVIADSHQLRHLSKRRWNYVEKGMQTGGGEKKKLKRSIIKMKIYETKHDPKISILRKQDEK